MLGLLLSEEAYERLERCTVAKCRLCARLPGGSVAGTPLNDTQLASSMMNRPKNIESFGYSKGSGPGVMVL